MSSSRLHSTPPDNCQFEKGNADTDLGRFGRFDVIHARAVLQGVKDFATFFKEVADILNPGGIFLTIEPEMGLFNEAKEPFGPQDEGDPVSSVVNVFTTSYLCDVLRRIAFGPKSCSRRMWKPLWWVRFTTSTRRCKVLIRGCLHLEKEPGFCGASQPAAHSEERTWRTLAGHRR